MPVMRTARLNLTARYEMVNRIINPRTDWQAGPGQHLIGKYVPIPDQWLRYATELVTPSN